MSPHHYTSLSLLPPPNNLRIDLNRFLHHYYIYWSFERCYTFENIHHVIGYRPVLGSLAAGDHYFEYRDSSNKPLVSVLFVISPSFDFDNPLINYSNSSIFDGESLYCFWVSVPKELPQSIKKCLQDLVDYEGFDIEPFIYFLEDFCQDFYRPPSPATHPITLPIEFIEPLRNYQ